MGAVVLVRHGETAFNRGGESSELVRGWTDVPLDSHGEEEAKKIARKLEKYDVKEVFCSTMERAKETAAQIAKACKCPMRVNVSLAPWNLGDLQGQHLEHVKDEINDLVEKDTEAPRLGEPFRSYRMRFLDFLHRKLQESEKLRKDDLLVLVTHGKGLQLTKAWMALDCPVSYEVDRKTMNDYSMQLKPGEMFSLRWNEMK